MKKFVLILALLIALCGAAWLVLDKLAVFADGPAGGAAQAAAGARQSLGRLFSGDIEATFRDELTTIFPMKAGNLEVAAFEAAATFTHVSTRTVAGIRVGTTEVEIRVPAIYRYHIPLDDPDWSATIEPDASTARITAPAPRPSLPVAIDTARLQKREREGWYRFDGRRQMEALERSMTPRLEENAHENLERIREDARRTVAEFVRLWLVREDHWEPGRFTALTIRFADEPEAAPAGPTLELAGAE